MFGKADHSEPLTLYSLILANPAERKSLVMRFVKFPFLSFAEDYNKRHKLYAEKDRLYSSYNSAKTEIKELDMMMKNVDMILGKDKEKDRRRDIQRKRSGELE